MPRYVFQCGSTDCGKCVTALRSMEQCNDAPFCPECRTRMHRVFTSPQLNTRPFLLEPANRDYLAINKGITSEKDKATYYKEQDRQYAERYK